MVVEGKGISGYRQLVIRALKERWSSMQWSIHLKTLSLHRVENKLGDLADVLLKFALNGSIPNPLILEYLQHSLDSHSISYTSVMLAICGHKTQSKPHCTWVLLNLLEKQKYRYGHQIQGSEESSGAALALLKVVLWLIQLIINTLENALFNDTLSEMAMKNCKSALSLLQFHGCQCSFSVAMLSIARLDDDEEASRLIADVKKLKLLIKSQNMLRMISTSMRSEMASILPRLIGGVVATKEGIKFCSAAAFQPIFAFDIFFKLGQDCSDDTTVYSLQAISSLHGLNISESLYNIIRSSLISVFSNDSDKDISQFDILLVDAFLLFRLPGILQQFYKLAKSCVNCSAALAMVSGAFPETSVHRSPTDFYQAFDCLLKNDSCLLDAVDTRCQQNIIEILVRSVVLVGKKDSISKNIITDTEADDIIKKRNASIEASPLSQRYNLTSSISTNRSHKFKAIKKFENVVLMIPSAMKSDGSGNKIEEWMENLLAYFGRILNKEELEDGGSVCLDTFVAVSIMSGSSGCQRLKNFIRSIISVNQICLESSGETSKCSILRSILFDVTFLTLFYISHVLVDSKYVLSESQGTLIGAWISDQFSSELMNTDENEIDNLLQQLRNGKLQTEGANWKNICINIYKAVRDMLSARFLGDLSPDLFNKMLTSIGSQVLTLSVCAILGFARHQVLFASNMFSDVDEIMLELCNKFESMELNINGYASDISAERSFLMKNILRAFKRKIIHHEKKGPSRQLSYKVTSSCQDLYYRVIHHRRCDPLDVEQWRQILLTCGPIWFVSFLVNKLIRDTVYQDELQIVSDVFISLVHIDLIPCCDALLSHVVPELIIGSFLIITDPHITALVKVIVTCVISGLLSESDGRTLSEIDGVEDIQLNVKDDSVLLTSLRFFLKCLGNVVHGDGKGNLSLSTCFTLQFIKETVRSSNSVLILREIDSSLVTKLIRLLPNSFTPNIITKCFDSTTKSGRKDILRTLVLLKNLKAT